MGIAASNVAAIAGDVVAAFPLSGSESHCVHGVVVTRGPRAVVAGW